jgi:hypothetical protein
MASIVLKSLSILLGIFFIFVGIMKITPKLSKDLHKDLVRKLSQRAEHLNLFFDPSSLMFIDGANTIMLG